MLGYCCSATDDNLRARLYNNLAYASTAVNCRLSWRELVVCNSVSVSVVKLHVNIIRQHGAVSVVHDPRQ